MHAGSLFQIILYVSDMAGEVHFYRDVIGLNIRYPQGISDYSQQMWVELDAGGCTLALHGGSKKPPTNDHEIIFKVDNLEQARTEILNAGIEIADIRLLEDGEPIAEGIDPDGHRFAIR
jgi:predicted enzyme related to lactoylglutathione lyase